MTSISVVLSLLELTRSNQLEVICSRASLLRRLPMLQFLSLFVSNKHQIFDSYSSSISSCVCVYTLLAMKQEPMEYYNIGIEISRPSWRQSGMIECSMYGTNRIRMQDGVVLCEDRVALIRLASMSSTLQ